jgi:hypothetical protein
MKIKPNKFMGTKLLVLILFFFSFISRGQNPMNINYEALIKAYPNMKKIFNAKDFEGWDADKSTWTIVDGSMRAKGGSSRLAYTKKDYGSFRLIVTSRMEEINGDHLGVLFWGDRPTNPVSPKTDGAGWIQYQPPHGAMWDYHPPMGKQPNYKVIAAGTRDYSKWTTAEILCDLDKGTMRAAVNGVELTLYTHPFPLERVNPEKKIISGPVCMMRHGGGTSLYRDIYIEDKPTKNVLITVGNMLSADDFELKNQVFVYPNPVKGSYFNAELNNSDIKEISIYTTTGKRIYNNKINQNQIIAQELKIEAPKHAGIYILSAKNAKGQSSNMKLIVE